MTRSDGKGSVVTEERPQYPFVPLSATKPQQRESDGDFEEAECERRFDHGLNELDFEQYIELVHGEGVLVPPIAVPAGENP